MSNEMILFDAKLPGQRAAAFASLNPQEESLADGIGSSYGVVGYKGKNWSLRYKGETYYFVRPDDGSPIAYLDVVLLRQARNKSKSFYPGGYVEGQSEGKRPICHSLDGIRPDADVQAKQCDACAICPKNVWRTDATGRKSKECTDYKRLAVLVLPSQTARFFGGVGPVEPMFLRIPPASLNPLSTYGEALQAQGLHYAEVITRVSFNPLKATPEFQFRAMARIGAAEAPVVLEQRENTQAMRITGEDKTLDGQQALVESAQSHISAQEAPAAAIQIAQAEAPPPTSIMGGGQVIDAKPVTAAVTHAPAAAAPAPAAAEPPPSFGLAQPAQGQVTAAPPVDPGASIGQTAADIGAPPANQQLDALIGDLMKKYQTANAATAG